VKPVGIVRHKGQLVGMGEMRRASQQVKESREIQRVQTRTIHLRYTAMSGGGKESKGKLGRLPALFSVGVVSLKVGERSISSEICKCVRLVLFV
jgi:hypothetical protein